MTAQRPLFSIVTITYNDLAGLQETAASVAGQTFKNFEWIVIDGGSKDGTLAFLDTLARQPDQRISERDKGIYDAMNKGIERANGVYTIFMNGGDRFASDFVLQRVAKRIDRKHPMPLLYGDTHIQSDKGELSLMQAMPVSSILYFMFACHQSIFYHTPHLKRHRYDLQYSLSADYKLTLQFMKAVNGKHRRLSFPISVSVPGGVSKIHAAKTRQQKDAIRAEFVVQGLAQNIRRRMFVKHLLKMCAPGLHKRWLPINRRRAERHYATQPHAWRQQLKKH